MDDEVYGFPLTPAERVILLSGALIGSGIIVAVLVVLSRLLEGTGMGLGDLFSEYGQLRGLFAALCMVHIVMLVGSLLHWRRCASTTLRCNHERLHFERSGWFGSAQQAQDFPVSDVVAVGIRRSRVFRAFELEVRTRAGHLVVPLQRATRGSARPLRIRSLDEARRHPLVGRLSALSGVNVTVE